MAFIVKGKMKTISKEEMKILTSELDINKDPARQLV